MYLLKIVKSFNVKMDCTIPWGPGGKNSAVRIPVAYDSMKVANGKRIRLYLEMFLEKDG